MCRARPTASSLFVMALLAAVVTGSSGCQSSSRTSDRSLVYVDPAEGEEFVLGRRKGLLGLGGKATAVWVDPRQQRQYERGHIAGAVNLPLQRVSLDHEELKRYDVLVVYGDDYNDPIAMSMSKRLIELGHPDVRTLRGGLRAWTDAGYPVETADG